MGARRKNVVILGSTGTIGRNTLDVVARHPERFRVLALSAHNSIALLQKQIQKFQPRWVCVGEKSFEILRNQSNSPTRILCGVEGLCQLASLPEADLIVIGISGSVAVHPFLSAVRAGKTVAPANKEALVIAGEWIMAEAKRHGARVIPVDSEQSAIFQCLEGQHRQEVRQVYLTASGGALAKVAANQFDRLSVSQILNHPRWRMGKKITVDSATLMNKGFEVIEACRLFDLSPRQIKVVIHPEAVIHSMVEFCDGAILAQLAVPDMRLPIQYALSYPQRLPATIAAVNFFQLGALTFTPPDLKKFPALALALDVAQKGGTFPAVLNAADEVAVEAFLREEIRLSHIYRVVERVVARHRSRGKARFAEILAAGDWAKEQANLEILKIKGK